MKLNTKKRLISCLLAITLLTSLLPSAAFAGEGDEEPVPETITLQEFVQKVEESNYTYDGHNVTVLIEPSSGCRNNHENHPAINEGTPDRIQFYDDIAYAQYQRFNQNTDISISNVTFKLVKPDNDILFCGAWNTTQATASKDKLDAELQFENTGSTTFSNCTFDNVAVSPISSQTSVSFDGCTFSGLGGYAIKDVQAASVSITNSKFTDCSGGVYMNGGGITQTTYTNNNFTNIGKRGAIQFGSSGNYTSAQVIIEQNKFIESSTESSGFIRQLNATLTKDILNIDSLTETNQLTGSPYLIDPLKPLTINGYGYQTLANALKAAKNNDTIEILDDITVDAAISEKKNLIFEGITKADGTKPVIRSAGANGLFSQSGDAVYTIKNLTLEISNEGQWYIYHSANALTIENCDFVMGNNVSYTGNVVMGEGSPSADEDYALIFKNNTITANSRAALVGIGNKSVITGNIIDLINEKHGNTDSRTSMIALTAVAGKGAVTISDNTFKNANRAIAVDNSSLAASDLTIKNNQFSNVRFAFELSPTKNANQGTFDLSRNYYIFNNTVSALKVQNADSDGDKFSFGDGSSEYLPEEKSLVTAEPYYTAPTMKDEDLNTYEPPSTGGGTVTPAPTPDPEQPSDSEDTVTNPDGSTTTTITKEDGSSSTTTVDSNGKVESSVTVSEEAVSNADGAAVALPIPEVAVTTDKDTAPTVTVTLPSKDATKVEVPVKDVTPGTVAVLVDADGNETVIKDTVLSDGGITVALADGATIKVVDNSKSFDDVTSDYWGASAIDFATSRELFAGTGENEFSPEGQMTRAMIWSVLARYEGADTAGATGNEWYAGPQEWAIANGISDGTMANSSMTREQLAAMLYRYSGSPAVSGTVGDFADAADISSWASDAMVWAVQQGLIAGMGDDTLSPQGTATRTQVAAILQRFIENKMA